MKNSNGFTLAEVLITLGIIGIIAALTIPTLIQKQQSTATVTALKKNFSILNQAFKSAVAENGEPQNWDSNPSSSVLLNTISKYLKVTKNCDTEAGCAPTSYINGNNSVDYDSDTNFAKAQLADGSLIMVFSQNSSCTTSTGDEAPLYATVCGYVYVDINGMKGPNKMAHDLFVFDLTRTGLLPSGSDFSYQKASGHCEGDTPMTCTAWVLYQGNMDYPNPPPSGAAVEEPALEVP